MIEKLIFNHHTTVWGIIDEEQRDDDCT